ncbi:DUF6194 family protein [Cyanobium sp. ULC065]|nr:hypothetical protein [Synechococcus sp. CS-1333]
MLPNGVYFCTIKQHNGDNDKSTSLDREDVFRLAIGLNPENYARMFGGKPTRPVKGGVVATEYDYTELNELMPHPIYAWISWVQILSPGRDKFREIFPLIQEAHQEAVKRFRSKTASIHFAAEQ